MKTHGIVGVVVVVVLLVFCLLPSAKDLGMTGVLVVVAVLFQLSHFLFRRNLSEKKSSLSGI